MTATSPESSSVELDPGVITGVSAAALAVPGVTAAAAVPRHGIRRFPERGALGPATGDSPARAVASTVSSEIYGGDLVVPPGAPMTLQDALEEAAAQSPEKGTVFIRRDGAASMQTFSELREEAQRVLGGLRAAGLRPGDAAMFQFDDNRAYVTAFWACVLGGFVPTPVAVSPTYRTANATTRRLYNSRKLLGDPVILTDAATEPALREVGGLWDEPNVSILVVEELAQHAPDHERFPTRPDSPVLNLLTSGSTGTPKCVQHTNASVAARTWSVAQERGYCSNDVTMNWMPLDHVAIVMYNVRDVFLRCLHVNAHVDHFLADPLAWLGWISEYGATTTWAPNFAFAMVNERAAEIEGRDWDLSSMRAICNAAEPVIASTSRRFLELLAPYGMPADAMWPGWGMSETCSVVTYECQHRDRADAATVAVAQSSLGGNIRHLDPTDPDAVIFSSVGPPTPGVTMRIADADGRTLPQERMGELLVRGETMMSGYHANPVANEESYDDEGWFRTGDLAFVTGGSVVIAGRIKDQIIVQGVNYIAHEIESVAEQCEGVRVTFSAATGVREPGDGSDRLVLFFVPLSWDTDRLAAAVVAIRGSIARQVGLVPDLIVPVTEAEFPKTGSGKIQRSALVSALREGRFDDRIETGEPAPESPWALSRHWTVLPGVSPADDGCSRGAVVVLGDGDVPVDSGRRTVVAVPRGDTESVTTALTEAARRHGSIDSVVLAWTLPDESRAVTEAADDYTAVFLAAVRATAAAAPEASLLVLTRGAVRAVDGDHVDLGAGVLPGLVRTAGAESPVVLTRLVDLPENRSGWGRALAVELGDRETAGVVAVRDGVRWVPRLRPLAGDHPEGSSPLTAGGLYVLTGGLGGLGYELASYLLGAYNAKVLLLGRSPAKGERAERLRELGELGEVEYHAVDVADTDAVATAVREAEQRWDRTTDVVLHLAGADPIGQWAELERHTLLTEQQATFDDFYRAKVAGTVAVGHLLEERPQAKAVLFGSVNGEFGGHSFGAYSAANSFLTAFADRWHHERGRDVRCLAWSMWAEVGMNAGQATAAVEQRGFRVIQPDEGLETLTEVLRSGHHQLVIGIDTTNPQIIPEMDGEVLGASELVVAWTGADCDPAAVERAVADAGRACPIPVRPVRLAELPVNVHGAVDVAQLLLDTAATVCDGGEVVEPVDPLEVQVAAVWSEILNRARVGRDQSFFDLGGSSLRASQLLSALDDRLSVRVRTQELYENPTVAGLAGVLERRGLSRAG